ncbi:MAG: NTP-binding protein [Alteromonadaceae bacterium]|nr:NTP-binding protein [Alteromonadaceae bacterium]MBH86376.1 NTP-binding protein [Alteromonadaceae bacterium]
MSASSLERGLASLAADESGVLRFSGKVIGPEVVQLRADGEKALARCQERRCEIDLAGVENANSMLLSLLLCWQRFAAEKGVDLRFSGANERLVALATMSRVSGHLPGLASL